MRHCSDCHGTGESGHGADAGTSPHKACGICHGFGLVFGPASSPPENLRAERDALKEKLAVAEARSARTFDGFLALRAKLSEAEALLREAREELHCMSVNNSKPIEPGKFQFGHPCDACDEYVDRNGKLRKKLDTFLSSVRNA